MEPQDVQRAAEVLSAGRTAHGRMARLPDEIRPADEAEAYAVQEALHRVLERAGHGVVTGYKIGCTTPVMQRFLNIPNPCAGGVFDSTVRRVDGRFSHADFLHVGVECELAVTLGRDLPAEGRPYDRDSVATAVATVMAAVEVVDDRWTDYKSIDTPTLIADDFFGAGCVLGEPVSSWQALGLESLTGRMSINGEQVGSGAGRDIMGHPLEALAWLANADASRGDGLKAGEFVLLGSLVETKWVERGDVVTIDVDALGTVTARFV